MRNFLKVTACLFLFVSGQSVADSHPVHFMACNFIEGKGMEDMMSYVEKWNEALGEGKGYNAYIMTPTFTSGPNTPDFIWAGAWESMTSMGAGWTPMRPMRKLRQLTAKVGLPLVKSILFGHLLKSAKVNLGTDAGQCGFNNLFP